MKKFLVILMVLALCVVAFAACEPKQPVDPQPEVEYNVDAAASYVFNLYKDKGTITASDFDVTAKVQVDGVPYAVEWTATEGVTITKKNENTYTVDVNEKATEEYTYTLTATVKAADGTTAQKSFTFTVPKYEVLSFEQYMAAAEGDTVTIEGIVVAINSKAAGNSRNHLFLADANVVGGYYSYQMDADPVADLGIEVGMTVSISGPVAPYSGMQEIKGGTAKIVDSTKKEVAVVDITEQFVNGDSLKNYVGLPVTIKGVEIAGQELGGTSEYLKFKLNDKTSYLRTYVTDFPTTLKAEDKATIDEAHAAKFGYTANVTGILVLYNNNPYLIPMSVDCFEYLEKVEKTPEQKIADTLDGLKIGTNFSSDAVVELLAAGSAYPEVALTWASNSEYAVVADGKLTITVPDAAIEVVVTVTATCDGKTATKEFKIKLSKSVTPVADIIALGASKEHNTYTEEKYLVAGIITEVYNTQYGNMKITDDQGNVLTIYGTYSADGADRYDAMANKPVAGDYVVIFGIVGQYNGTPQVKNGWIMSFTTPTSVKDTLDLGASKEHNTYTEDKYLVTGVITEVYNTQYGNMKITDAEGNILTVYGTYSATGALRYDAMEKKPVAGDTVTVYGIVGQYNGTPQIKNAWIVANVAGAGETPDPDPEPDPDPTPDPSGDPAADSVLTVEQVLALGASKEHNTYTEGKYYVTGVITEIYNTQYGNMKITDDKGNILTIYGTYDATGANRFDAMANQPAVGDTITVYGIVGQYNNTPQVKNGWITEHTAAGGTTPEPDPKPDPDPTPVTGNTVDMPSFSLGDGKDTAYAERTNSQGWTTTGAAILTGKDYAGADTWAITLNGKTSAPGTLTSPALTGGIKSLSFKYGFPFGDNQFKLTISIKKGGEVVATTVLEKTGLTKETVYDFTWNLDTAIEGEFTIVIENNCLSGSDKNKDRLSIWDITWGN